MKNLYLSTMGLGLLLLISGCAATNKGGGVVIPAISTSTQKSEPAKSQVTLPTTVAVLPFINRTDKKAAFDIVRKTMYNHFSTRNYHLLHLSDVDQRLKAAGWSDPAKLDGIPADKLAETLGADGVLYGEITHYDRFFLGIYAQIAVGVRLRLVNREGKEVWRGEDTVRTHAGGISTTPVGLILDAIAAASHLRQINMYRAADDLGRELIPQIPESEYAATMQAPRILQVVHDGVGRVLKYGDKLKVAMEGKPGQKAFVRIEGWKTVDMQEEQSGFYTATITPGPKDNINGAVLVGILQGDSGLQRQQISPLGLVTIDNIPPQPVTHIEASNTADAIHLNWQAQGDDTDAFAILAAEHELGPFTPLATTRDMHYSDKTIKPFEQRFYRIQALDKAGNASQPVTISASLTADSRFAGAKPLPAQLPGEVHGIAVLRAADDPFRLSSNVHIAADAVLLIEPGVHIIASSGGAMQVSGELRSFGSRDAPVVIAADQGQSFKGLTLAGDKPVMLNYTEINGAQLGLTITRGNPSIRHCRILNSQFSALDIRGVSRPEISDSEIRGATSGAVLISGKAQPVFHGNTFTNNEPFHIQSGSPYRIDARGNHWQPAASAGTILGNVDYSIGGKQ